MSNSEQNFPISHNSENTPEKTIQNAAYRARGEKANVAAAQKALKREAELRQSISAKEKHLADLLAEMQTRFPEQPPVEPKTTEKSSKHETTSHHEKDNLDDYIESIRSAANAAISPAAVKRVNQSTGPAAKSKQDVVWDWDELRKYKMSSANSASTKSANPNPSDSNPANPKSETARPETISKEAAKEAYDKSKRKSAFRKATQKIIAGTLVALAVVSGASSYLLHRYGNPSSSEITETSPDRPIFVDSNNYPSQPPFIEADQAQEESHSRFEGMSYQEILDMMAKSPEFRQGLIDGYDKEGLWTSSNKPSEIAFASASELSKLFGNDEVSMMRYTAANQTESFADYLACLPESVKPEDVQGLSMEQISQMLETTDDHSYRLLQTEFNNIIGQAYTRRKVLNGRYNNAYMMLKDGKGPLTHENMQLVNCVSNEYGTEVTEFYWVDDEGREIGSMLVKMIPVYDEDHNIASFKGCMQAVTPAGSYIYYDLPSVDPPAPQPETPPDDPEPPVPIPITILPDPKDDENLIRIDDQIFEDISEDIGENQDGTNEGVKPDEDAQTAADEAEIPIDEAPTDGTELEDILADLGIS